MFNQRVDGEKFRDQLYQNLVIKMLKRADIIIGGSRPWDIQIHDPRTYKRIILEHSIGAGESYMDGWWDCARLDLLFYRLFRSEAEAPALPFIKLLGELAPRLLNLQSRRRSKVVNEVHYDLSLPLYEAMLGDNLVYTCAYWQDVSHLEAAQYQKLELVCRKLALRPGMRILDIGCGFGSFLKYASEHYGVEGVGYTLSKAQYEVAKRRCAHLPIQIKYGDYRDIYGQYDRIASIGMFEAVGQKNMGHFMRVLHRNIKKDGAILLHTIGKDIPRKASRHWVDKYIFPNGYLPELTELSQSMVGLFRVEDLHNIGPDYDLTLMAWHRRFLEAWPQLSAQLSERFRRMWELYLLLFAGGFRARHWQLWQVLIAPRTAEAQVSRRRDVHGFEGTQSPQLMVVGS